MGRIRDWFHLEGETTTERIRNNPLQLLVLGVIVWFFAMGAYASLIGFLGSTWTSIVMVLVAIAVGLHLRRLMTEPIAQPE